METLFENLHLYEIVLLFLGIFLFIILCAGLVYFIVKKDDLKKLLLFFPFPILMIGYPSIQEIKIQKDKIALVKYTDKVLENPKNKEVQAELMKVTEKLEKRANSVENLKAVSEANLILGNSEKVINLTNKALEKKAENREENDEPTDTSPIGIISHKNAISTETLYTLKRLAAIQKSYKTKPLALIDTVEIRRQIQMVKWNNPKTKKYLDTKFINQIMQVNTAVTH